MVYDDDDGSHPSATIRPEERPRKEIEESRLPAEDVRREIIRLATEEKMRPPRIEVELRRVGFNNKKRHVPVDVIRYVLERHQATHKR